MTRKDIMTAEEIADILGIQKATLYDKRWRRETGIPIFKQGKYLFALRSKFMEWYSGRMSYA